MEMPEEQAGFVEGKGTRDQLVNIRMLIEKCHDHGIPLYVGFIDYAKAFDCVSHELLWHAMTEMGFPSHIVNLINSLYHQQESAVRTAEGLTDWFTIGRGVRQGCPMSPALYNIYAESIMREALEGFFGGISIGGRMVSNLRFADDTTLVSSSKEELDDLLRRVKEASKTRHLLLNIQKTKIMVLDNNRPENDPFIIDGERIEEVDSFVYLGSLINNKGSTTQELRRRLAIGREAVQKLATIWKSRGVTITMKVRVLQAIVFPAALYGCEAWALTPTDQRRLDAFEMWCYRRLLRISWMERCTNERVLERIGSDLVLRKAMTKRKLLLFGHLMRRSGSLEKVLIQGKVEGKRRRGRPATPWFQTIRDTTGVGLAAAAQLAANRQGWRGIIRTTAAPGAT
jgi:hypothetical protein